MLLNIKLKSNFNFYVTTFCKRCRVKIRPCCIYIEKYIDLLKISLFKSTCNQLFGALLYTIVQGSHIPAIAYTV